MKGTYFRVKGCASRKEQIALGFQLMGERITRIHMHSDGILPFTVTALKREFTEPIMQDEQSLLEGLFAFDARSITAIHDRYFPMVYRYARYRVSDLTVAEDLSAEAFTRLLEAVFAGKGPRKSLNGWLMGTISNLVNDYYRTVYADPIDPIPLEMQANGGDPVAQVEQADQTEALRVALGQLTTEQQHVLALRFGSGCSLNETAEIMDKNTNAVKQLQFRALAALKRHLGGQI